MAGFRFKIRLRVRFTVRAGVRFRDCVKVGISICILHVCHLPSY